MAFLGPKLNQFYTRIEALTYFGTERLEGFLFEANRRIGQVIFPIPGVAPTLSNVHMYHTMYWKIFPPLIAEVLKG